MKFHVLHDMIVIVLVDGVASLQIAGLSILISGSVECVHSYFVLKISLGIESRNVVSGVIKLLWDCKILFL
jgi:hypothetical protein